MLRPLTQYLGKKKVHKTRNLLESQDTMEEVEEEPEAQGATVASYYHSNFTLSFINNAGPAAYGALHPAVKQFYMLEATGARDESGKNGYFYPIVYHNTFWQMKKDMVELNTTIPFDTLPMNIRLSTLANWQFNVMASMDEGMKGTARKAAQGQSTPGGGDGSEMEMFKEILLDSNMYLLGTTAVVSVLHMIFELLAFKSDVGHWRKKKDNVGVSVRTILTFQQIARLVNLLLSKVLRQGSEHAVCRRGVIVGRSRVELSTSLANKDVCKQSSVVLDALGYRDARSNLTCVLALQRKVLLFQNQASSRHSTQRRQDNTGRDVQADVDIRVGGPQRSDADGHCAPCARLGAAWGGNVGCRRRCFLTSSGELLDCVLDTNEDGDVLANGPEVPVSTAGVGCCCFGLGHFGDCFAVDAAKGYGEIKQMCRRAERRGNTTETKVGRAA
ncbi:hypothetical protein ES708_11502 [subsurface metagenome]